MWSFQQYDLWPVTLGSVFNCVSLKRVKPCCNRILLHAYCGHAEVYRGQGQLPMYTFYQRSFSWLLGVMYPHHSLVKTSRQYCDLKDSNWTQNLLQSRTWLWGELNWREEWAQQYLRKSTATFGLYNWEICPDRTLTALISHHKMCSHRFPTSSPFILGSSGIIEVKYLIQEYNMPRQGSNPHHNLKIMSFAL